MHISCDVRLIEYPLQISKRPIQPWNEQSGTSKTFITHVVLGFRCKKRHCCDVIH